MTDQTFSLANSLGAGKQLRSNLESATQNREFNSLRISGERQRQDIQQQELNTDQQRANSEKMLVGFEIMKTSPNIIPKVLEEFAGSGIINQAAIPSMLAEAQSSPETFQQKMDDFAAELRFNLSQGPATREDRKILTGADKINRFVDTGEQVFEGVEAPTGIAAAGAAERFFGSLTADLSAEQQADATLIQLGLQERAGTTSSRERIATDPELTEDVAESEATIAQRRKFGEATGALRSKLIDKGFKTVQSITVNLRNLDKAIAAIDEGALTGVIESRFFPTIRKSTVKLEQIQSELGLDVVGGVTFGALSKGELDLALTVALPLGLQPPELRQWLQDKKTAQEKLRAYYAQQIDFLDQGGTIAGFIRSQERGGSQSVDNVIRFDAQGNPIG